MRSTTTPRGRAGFGAAAAAIAFATSVLAACAAASPRPTASAPTSRAVAATLALPATTPAPWSPTEFTLNKVDRPFPSVAALTSTGEHLYWGSEAAVWRFTPGDLGPQRVHESPSEGSLIWDVAATDEAFVLSELLGSPPGAWRVSYVPRDGATPVELDGGVADRGAPPTLAIDGRRIAWAGFDESSGAPRSFLRVVDRARPDAPATLIDLDIDHGLLWYPQLDGDTLWYGLIEPDFAGTGVGDDIHIETIDLANPAAGSARFDGWGNDFSPAVSADYMVWKSVEPGFAALTWGELHVLDRGSHERLLIADQANNPSIGSRFVGFEEISHQKLLVYDLGTRTLVEIPDPMAGTNGTVGPVAIAGNLFGYNVSAKGAKTVFWTILPD
jgi:hypothetical protein